jgi:cell wall-associated NlpC family hydrolase
MADMSGFFGDPSAIIGHIGSAIGSLAPAPAPQASFAPGQGPGNGGFAPAPMVAGSNAWPTVTIGGGGFQPAQMQGGSFQPSGGMGGGFQPSGGIGGSPFQPSAQNPLLAPKAPASTSAPTQGGTATYSGLKPDVAQWAGQVQSTFGKYGSFVSDAMLAIIQHESEGNPNAYNGASAGGAWGLFQQMGLGSYDPNTEFAAAEQLLQQKLKMTNDAYARLGLNPDDRTRARDLFLAWAGQFDPNTAGPNGNRDEGNGQDAEAFLNGPRGIMPMYDNIVRGKQQGSAGANAGGLVGRAESLVGTPYSLGGLRGHPDQPQLGLDCSEFTAWVYQGQGIALSWNAQQQYNQTQRVDPQNLQVGDLVFFHGTNAADPDYITHVGMYIGNGRMINAQDGGVMEADLNSQYWQQHYAGAGRVQGVQFGAR